MAVLYVTETPEGRTEIYDKVRARLFKGEGTPPGLVYHVASERDGGGLLVAEVWESEQDRDRWAKKVDEVLEELGAPKRPQPRKHKVHNIMSPETASVR